MTIQQQIQNCLDIESRDKALLESYPTLQKLLSHYGISYNSIIKGGSKSKLRTLCYFLSLDGYTPRDIAPIVNKDRTTIYHHIKIYKEFLEVDKEFKKEHKKLLNYLNDGRA